MLGFAGRSVISWFSSLVHRLTGLLRITAPVHTYLHLGLVKTQLIIQKSVTCHMMNGADT